MTSDGQFEIEVDVEKIDLSCGSDLAVDPHPASSRPEQQQPLLLHIQCAQQSSGGLVVSEEFDHTGVFLWAGVRKFVHWISEVAKMGRDITRQQQLLTSALRPDHQIGNTVGSFPLAIATTSCLGLQALELGGGVGLGSMALAALIPTTICITTDFDDASLKLAAINAERNVGILSRRNNSSVRTLNVNWLDFISKKNDGDEKPAGQVTTSQPQNALALRILQQFPMQQEPITLFGCDVIYPDTRSDVLVGLFSTVRCMLAAEDHDGSFLTTFTDRDGQCTLRRLIAAAAIVGLQVDPIVSPFTSSSLLEAADAIGLVDEVRRDTSSNESLLKRCLTERNLKTMASNSWIQVVEATKAKAAKGKCKKLGIPALSVAVCSMDVWFLRVSIAPASTPPSALECDECINYLSQNPTGDQLLEYLQCQGKADHSELWFRHFPWMWHNDVPFQASLRYGWDTTTNAIRLMTAGPQAEIDEEVFDFPFMIAGDEDEDEGTSQQL